LENLTPREVVEELDKYIIGQQKAKKAVAIALRNRYRRKNLPEEIRDEIYPKNIIMIGSTGVGKTEIARRLARLVNAPFIKVEASKFTEVGYVGRDVDSMVRDLLQTSIRMVKQEKMQVVDDKARELAEERIVDYILPLPRKKNRPARNPLEFLLGSATENNEENEEEAEQKTESIEEKRKIIKQKISRYELDKEVIEIEVEEKNTSFMEIISGSGVEEMGINLQDMFGQMLPKNKKKRKVTVEEARKMLTFEEAQRLIDMDEVYREAIRKTEEDGIIFLDEIDKITSREGPFVVSEHIIKDSGTETKTAQPGIPGTDNNIPQYEEVNTEAGTSTWDKSDKTVNYDINKTQTTTRFSLGDVQYDYLTVSVFVNRAGTENANIGEDEEEKIEKVRNIVATACGLRENRENENVRLQDNISVAFIDFYTEPEPSAGPQGALQRFAASPYAPWIMALLATMLVLLIWLLLKRRGQKTAELEPEAADGFETLVEENINMADIIDQNLTPEEKERQRIRAEVDKIIDENPENAAQVIKVWLLEDVR